MSEEQMRLTIAKLIEPNSWAVEGMGLRDSLAHDNRRTSSLRKADKILAALSRIDGGGVSG